MRMPGATLRRTAERLLLLEGPVAAESALQVQAKLTRRLSPLVGEAGVKALFARSLRLAIGHSPASWATAPDAPPAAPPEEPTERMRDSLRRQDEQVAMESAVTLFAFFLQLLTTFLGGPLTAKVLRGAWPDVSTGEIEETDE